MRKALNENPVVQIALLGVLGLLVAVVFMTRMGGGSAEPEATTSTPTTPGTPEAAAATPVAPGPATSVAPASATPAPQATRLAVPGDTPFEAGKGLPAPLVDAFKSGDVVVLLVVQEKGIEDKRLEREVNALRSHDNTSVFVTDAKNVGKYSRIAQGVKLDRVPAIIALKPVDPKAKGGDLPLPEASITYGYMGPGGVEQVLGDARYDGKVSGYDPG